MRTECWLLEESRYKTMILNIVDILLFESTLAISLLNRFGGNLLVGHSIFIVVGHR